tara:strand:+ start:2385 stop:2585 length:201 start_codon:yes stop_codon:yes gene_type:complete
MKDRRTPCQTKKDAHVADATQSSVDATVAAMIEKSKKVTGQEPKNERCCVCECDPCDCGWGSYLAD